MSEPRALRISLPAGSVIGSEVTAYRVLGSTNDRAMEEVAGGGPDGLVVVADEQTVGRGRFSRAWRSAPGDDLLVSVGLRPPAIVARVLSVIAGAAVARTVDRLTGARAAIKWPNDVRVEGRKIAGILVESRVEGDDIAAVIGIGLNLMLDPARWDEIAGTATSVFRLTGERVERDRALEVLLAELDDLYRRALGGESTIGEWSDRLDTIGGRVELALAPGGESIAGVATGVTGSGALIVRMDDGSKRQFEAGEVTSQTVIAG